MAPAQRRMFLITYSQANLDLVPSKEVFAAKVVEAFGEDKVECWCCCQEKHEDGNPHYHMLIRFYGPVRWLPVKNMLSADGIELHFSFDNDFSTYSDGYKYISKEDPGAPSH